MNALKNFANNHPNLTSWLILAVGMVIILIWTAQDVGFTTQQWVAIIITTILLAGACVWIISWGEDEEEHSELNES
ncbi:MAG: hypothetical protein AAF629_25735 [Chloroflexota bacterium]